MPKTVVSVRMEDDLIKRIKALADARRWSVSQWVAVAAERVATGEEQKPGGRR